MLHYLTFIVQSGLWGFDIFLWRVDAEAVFASPLLWIWVHCFCWDLKTKAAKPEWTNAAHLTLGGLFAPVRQPKYLPVIVDDTPGFNALNGFDGEAGLCHTGVMELQN